MTLSKKGRKVLTAPLPGSNSSGAQYVNSWPLRKRGSLAQTPVAGAQSPTLRQSKRRTKLPGQLVRDKKCTGLLIWIMCGESYHLGEGAYGPESHRSPVHRYVAASSPFPAPASRATLNPCAGMISCPVGRSGCSWSCPKVP